MPILPVPGGGGATIPQTYYNTPIQFGEYKFISLEEIVENFIAAYVGEGKILANALKGDVNFHAHRALQELHYDTLRSCKSQEIEVCPSLKMPLPHDYVNYVKLTSVDENGIEHIIYPTRHTSHPFAVSQNDDCDYEFETGGGLSTEETCDEITVGTELCSGTAINDAAKIDGSTPFGIPYIDDPTLFPGHAPNVITSFQTFLTVPMPNVSYDSMVDGLVQYRGAINIFCECLRDNNITPNCGTHTVSGIVDTTTMNRFADQTDANGNVVPYELLHFTHHWDSPDYQNWVSTGQWPVSVGASGVITTSSENCDKESSTWTSYSGGGGGNSIGTGGGSDPSVDNSNFFQNTGERYGLEPEHAQANGSFFIDCMRGNIHFGSNLSGKTIILHYLSDGHGTLDEAIVPKLAEEAMYKWIAYGCLSARADIPENIVQRYKKEKFAETRKAKIRISNIKIEEISQIMRGKSKWIKH